MRGYSMDVEVRELSTELPDGRTIQKVYSINEDFNAVRVYINEKEDTVFTHEKIVQGTPTTYIGLCFNPDILNAKRLNLCVRNCTNGSNSSPKVLFEFEKPEKIWEGFYKVVTQYEIFYVKTKN